MAITKKQIEEYKQLYIEEFGGEITDAEASEIIHHLLALYEILSKPLPEEIDQHKASEEI